MKRDCGICEVGPHGAVMCPVPKGIEHPTPLKEVGSDEQTPVTFHMPSHLAEGVLDSQPTKEGDAIRFKGLDGIAQDMRVKSVVESGDGWDITLEPVP